MDKCMANQRKRAPRIDSLNAVLKEMRRVYAEARLGLMPTKEMTRFIFALKCMREVVEASVLEDRLIELERKAGLVAPARFGGEFNRPLLGYSHDETH